ncbi:hypothetical protein PAHAL_1G123900 [Panicum hallii]|uniref:Uncharacterized protein n=1 Tax=Panicum hallii TaxID=206008 RepID=A0A2S3GNQ9_9POAL|nr:hypothetical protein PAHAL_1G123900 [Panicum hallii]
MEVGGCPPWMDRCLRPRIIFLTIKSAGLGSNGASRSPGPPPLRRARRHRIRTRQRLAATAGSPPLTSSGSAPART